MTTTHIDESTEPGVFFLYPSSPSSWPIKVFVEGVETKGYSIFHEHGGEGRTMVYFDAMTFAERCSVQIQFERVPA